MGYIQRIGQNKINVLDRGYYLQKGKGYNTPTNQCRVQSTIIVNVVSQSDQVIILTENTVKKLVLNQANITCD